MGEYEERVRVAIERKYGSIPKMANATGIAKNTIYHALERGLDNTTTKTRQSILEPLYGTRSLQYSIVDIDEQPEDEQELLALYRGLSTAQRIAVLELMRVM